MNDKVVLVGNSEEFHIGAHLLRGAEDLGLNVKFCDIKKAFYGPRLITRVNWRLRGHRPTRLRKFSSEVTEVCQEFRPKYMLSVGLAPIEYRDLVKIGQMGIERLNYLTDDPWNPAHRAGWFIQGLPMYDHVFSTRMANIKDLKKLGCPKVSYLPFAYSPDLHFPETSITPEERARFDSDVVFAGGADKNRFSYIIALIKGGFHLALYGGYWQRYPQTKAYIHGHADPRTLRKAISLAKVVLCLVRRANRDGHSMRTFEIPAIGACMLTEDTHEHREIFGREWENTLYFKETEEMIDKLRFLLNNEAERNRLSKASHDLIVNNRNSYKDRLKTILGI